MLIYSLTTIFISFILSASSYTLLKSVKLLPGESFSRIILSLGVGFGAISFLTYILGLLQILSAGNLQLLLIAAILVSFPSVNEYIADLRYLLQTLFVSTRKEVIKIKNNPIAHWFEIAALVLTVANAVVLTLATFTPPVGWDALNYHLSVPKIYLLSEGIFNLPTEHHSHFPLPIQFVNAFFQSVSNDIVAQSVQLVLAVGSLLIVYELNKRFAKGNTLISFSILFSIPVFLFIIPEGHVDMAATFYVMLGLYMFLLYRETQKAKYLVITFIAVAYASATKYTNLPFIFIFALLFWFMKKFEHNNVRLPLKNITVVSLAILIPWYAKSWLYVGNPFWPFFYSIFPSTYPPNVYYDSSGIPGVKQITEPNNALVINIIEKIKDFSTRLWRMTFFPQQFGGDQPKVGPLVLGLLPTAFAVTFKKRDQWKVTTYIGILVASFFLMWSFAFGNTRYLAPIFPALAILLSIGVTKLYTQTFYLKHIVHLIIIGSLAMSTLVTFKLHVNKLPAAFGLVDTDTYYRELTHPLGSGVRIQEYSASTFANKELDQNNTKILVLQGLFGYFLDHEYERGRPDSQSKYDYSKTQNIDEVLELFKTNNVTHILTRFKPETENTPPEYTEEELADIQTKTKRGFEIVEYELIPNHAKLIFQENEVYLYEVQYTHND